MNNQLGVISLLVLSIIFSHVRAQRAPSSGDVVSDFQPSLAVVIGILGLMFTLTFILLIYAKFCQRNTLFPLGDPENENQPTLGRSRSRFSGIDKTAIESLPFFRFSSLRGSKEGLECAVCLSKFEDVEILRLLPKCKHAFHIDCIDHWLEKHSSCPLCRLKVNPEDQTIFTYSNSLRRLVNQPGLGEESNIELFVRREEEQHHGSARFSIGSSFRKIVKDIKEEELPIQRGEEDSDGNHKAYHKHNHRITISDVVFKHRWSSVSSSDLMFLNSELLNDASSSRFNNLESNVDMMPTTRVVENDQIMNIKEEMERKISFESKVGALNKINSVSDKGPPSTSDSAGNSSHAITKHLNPGEKRSMSEITAVSRFGDLGMKHKAFKDSSLLEKNLKEERMRQLWFPIARRTVQWFVNRERRSQQFQNKQQPLDA